MIDFDYTVVKSSRRKTASICVSHDNKVVISVPRHISEEQIRAIVERKAKWIVSKLELNREIQPGRKARLYKAGELFLFLGRNYRLVLDEADSQTGVKIGNGTLIARIPRISANQNRHEIVAKLLIRWYKTQAGEHLAHRVFHYQDVVGAKPLSIRIKDLKSRWGSCSSKGAISFNWRIIMAPEDVIDYLVVHELCHLIEHNHSVRYWNLVRSVLPNYGSSRSWLKTNGFSLEL